MDANDMLKLAKGELQPAPAVEGPSPEEKKVALEAALQIVCAAVRHSGIENVRYGVAVKATQIAWDLVKEVSRKR